MKSYAPSKLQMLSNSEIHNCGPQIVHAEQSESMIAYVCFLSLSRLPYI